MERVLTDERVKARIGKLCVGLAAECDPPGAEAEVAKILREKLAGASTLPFVGFVTPDLKWVHGFSGGRSVDAFVADLDTVEKSPLLAASPEGVKKLEALAAQAAAAVEKSQWQKVLKAAHDADAISGRSDVREKIADSVAKARAWAESEIAAVLKSLAEGGDRAAARGALKRVASAFAGEPEAKDAEAGVKAADRLDILAKLDPAKLDAAREKAAKDFDGTRWRALFEKPAK